VLAAEASASGSTGVVLESPVAILGTEGVAWHMHLHLWLVHLWWFEELVRLREARPNVTSGGLPWNDTFLLPSYSISLILFSIAMALSTMCWKST
jgi:hypothetical protein